MHGIKRICKKYATLQMLIQKIIDDWKVKYISPHIEEKICMWFARAMALFYNTKRMTIPDQQRTVLTCHLQSPRSDNEQREAETQ